MKRTHASRRSQKRGRDKLALKSLFQLILRNGGKNGRGKKHKKRQKPRNHPANPIGGPDLPCITLPAYSVQFPEKPLTEQSAGPFSHSPFWTAVAVRRRPADGFGTLCLCIYYTTDFSDVKLVWPNFLKKSLNRGCRHRFLRSKHSFSGFFCFFRLDFAPVGDIL